MPKKRASVPLGFPALTVSLLGESWRAIGQNHGGALDTARNFADALMQHVRDGNIATPRQG